MMMQQNNVLVLRIKVTAMVPVMAQAMDSTSQGTGHGAEFHTELWTLV